LSLLIAIANLEAYSGKRLNSEYAGIAQIDICFTFLWYLPSVWMKEREDGIDKLTEEVSSGRLLMNVSLKTRVD